MNPFLLLSALSAVTLLAGCGRDASFGEPRGDVSACLIALDPTVDAGASIRFALTIRNLSDHALQWPDMNDPRAWVLHFELVGGDAHVAAYGCHARIGAERNPPAAPLSLAAGEKATVTAFLPGNWGGWSRTVPLQSNGRIMSMAEKFPPAGRYRVTAAYVPFHAARPGLADLRGFGVVTNCVIIQFR